MTHRSQGKKLYTFQTSREWCLFLQQTANTISNVASMNCSTQQDLHITGLSHAQVSQVHDCGCTSCGMISCRRFCCRSSDITSKSSAWHYLLVPISDHMYLSHRMVLWKSIEQSSCHVYYLQTKTIVTKQKQKKIKYSTMTF
jgi:hypothetical protein